MITTTHHRPNLLHLAKAVLALMVISGCFVATISPARAQTPLELSAQAANPTSQTTNHSDTNQFSLSPAFQEVVISTATPSATIEIVVTNSTAVATTFEAFALEYPQVDHFGSLQFVDFKREDAISMMPGYLRFEVQQFVLDPGQQKRVQTRVTDRASLRPGGTYVAIVVRAVSERISGTQPVIPALSSQLLIRKLAGEVQNLSLSEVTNLPPSVSFILPHKLGTIFINNGNVHLTPHGRAQITDMFGRVVRQGTINESSLTILPGRQRELPLPLAKSRWVFPVNLLTISLNGTADVTSFSYEHTFVFVSPWFVIGLAGLTSILWRYRAQIARKLKFSRPISLKKPT